MIIDTHIQSILEFHTLKIHYKCEKIIKVKFDMNVKIIRFRKVIMKYSSTLNTSTPTVTSIFYN